MRLAASALVAGALACWSAGCGEARTIRPATSQPQLPADAPADWRDSLQMARAMLLFDQPRAALLYARSAVVLSPGPAQRAQADALLARAGRRCLDHAQKAGAREEQRRRLLVGDVRLDRYRVAVLPFERGWDGQPSGRGRLLAELLLDGFRRDRYRPVERVQFDRVIEEQDLSAALDASALRKVRRDVGADLLVVGTIHDEPGEMHVVARMVDTASAEVVQSASVSVAPGWDAKAVARRLAESLQLTDEHRQVRREGRLTSRWLARAEALAHAGKMDEALETYVDLLAIDEDSVEVRRSFARFQETHAGLLCFEIPRDRPEKHTGPRRLRLRVGESTWLDLVELPPPAWEGCKPVWMAATEITQAQYAEVIKTRPSFRKGEDLPVEGVSFHDARGFCDELSRRVGLTIRLPSESEWEYACRAGAETPYSFGEECTFDRANVARLAVERPGAERRGKGRTLPVRSFPPNAWGLYEMHGNVAEWCLPRAWGDPPREPAGEELPDRCPTRGGSWISHADEARCGASTPAGPSGRTGDVGFRVVVQASSSPDLAAKRQDGPRRVDPPVARPR